MYERMFFVLFFMILMSDAVKIGISKPITTTESNTTELTETTTTEVAITTTVTPTITLKPIKSTAPNANTISTSTTSLPTTLIETTTAAITSSTTTTTPDTLNNTTKSSSIRNENLDYSGYFCECNLRHHVCEVNCCCDIDCIAEELNVFDCQEEKIRLEDFLYHQGLPPCKINEGWLCVFRNNYNDDKGKRIEYNTNMGTIRKWPQLILESDNTPSERAFYKIGEPVYLYNFDLNENTEFDIPFSIIDQNCQIFDSIRHLSPKMTSCLITLERAQNLEIQLYLKLSSSLILQRPNVKIPLNGVLKDGLIPITIYCDPPPSANSTAIEFFDEFEYSSLIHTKIYHNITDILACEVFFNRTKTVVKEIWQHYQVDFIHVNETDPGPLNVSGPLGYNLGSPLIIAQKVLLNKSLDHTESNKILSYFHPMRTQPIHIHHPRRRNNLCEVNNSTTVNYGESLLSQCNVQLDNSTELNSDSNFTKICGDLQESVFHYLQFDEIVECQDEFFLSMLGYPKNSSNNWIKIEVRNYDYFPIVGSYLGDEDAFVCQNMILDVTFELLTLRDEVGGVLHQNILKRAVVDVGRRHDLQFEMDEMILVPVTFSVIFQDLREMSGAVMLANYAYRMVAFSMLVVLYLVNKMNSIS